MKKQWTLLSFFVMVLLGGCATMPTGPTVSVMPGPGKPFEVFQADDYACRQWALQQIGGASPSQTANQNLATGAVVGTAIGAGLGAAIGSASGQAGAGALIGAGAGLLGGTAMAKWSRPLIPSISSRGATTSLINNACMRRETRSPVSCACRLEPMGHLHHRQETLQDRGLRSRVSP